MPQYTQDLDKAKALLAEAGYADGFPLEITYAAENQNEARFAPLLQDAFSQLGIDVTLTPMLFNQQWERAKGDPAGRQDMFLLLYWPTYSDAGSDNLWSLFHSSEAPFFNLSYWKNADYDALVDDAGTMTATDGPPPRPSTGGDEPPRRPGARAPSSTTRSSWCRSRTVAGYEYNLNYPFAQFFYPLHPAN